MEEQLLISVIVPVYNVEKYLSRCLDSIINQTYKNLEILLIDDGATDNSGAICDEYAQKDNRIRVFHKENGGVSSARNMGLDNATGEYVGFIDSDDYVELEYFEVLLKVAKEHNADIARCCELGEKEQEERVDVYKTENYNFAQVHTTKFDVMVWCSIYRVDKLRTIRFDESLYVGEDSYFNAQVVKNSNLMACSTKRLYFYQTNPISATKGTFDKKKYTELESWKRICELFNDNVEVQETCFAAYALRCRLMIERNYRNTLFKKEYYKLMLTEYRKNYKFVKKYLAIGIRKKLIFALFYFSPRLFLLIKTNRDKN